MTILKFHDFSRFSMTVRTPSIVCICAFPACRIYSASIFAYEEIKSESTDHLSGCPSRAEFHFSGELTSHRHGLRQAERHRLPVRIVELCHPLGVPVDLGQEHASAAGDTDNTVFNRVLASACRQTHRGKRVCVCVDSKCNDIEIYKIKGEN